MLKHTNNKKASAWLRACVPGRAGVWACGRGGMVGACAPAKFYFFKVTKFRFSKNFFI